MGATEDLFAGIASCPMPLNFDNWSPADRARSEAVRAEQTAVGLTKVAAAIAADANWRELRGPGGRDAAFAAATCASSEPLRLLLAHDVPLTHQSVDGGLIHRAAAFSAVAVIDLLVELGVAPDQTDQYGRTPVAVARTSQHGVAAVPHLIELMRRHQCVPAPAKRGDDIRLETTKGRTLGRVLTAILDGFFVERAGVSSNELLKAVLGADDPEALARTVHLVREVSTAAPKTKTIKMRKRAELVHHGDLHITGDVGVNAVAVTGNLTVDGRLDNFNGAPVTVGGDLSASAVWSEGPLIVGGNLTADVFACATNDYAAQIAGALTTSLLVQLDRHVVKTGLLAAQQTVTDRDQIPASANVMLGR